MVVAIQGLVLLFLAIQQQAAVLQIAAVLALGKILQISGHHLV